MSVIQLKALGISNLVRFDFPSAPPSKNLISALELLFALGALNEKGELTKPLGEQMSELPLHPTLSKMLLTSSTFNCTREVYPLNCKQARNRASHNFPLEGDSCLTSFCLFWFTYVSHICFTDLYNCRRVASGKCVSNTIQPSCQSKVKA